MAYFPWTPPSLIVAHLYIRYQKLLSVLNMENNPLLLKFI